MSGPLPGSGAGAGTKGLLAGLFPGTPDWSYPSPVTDGDEEPPGRAADGDEPYVGNDDAGRHPGTDVDEALPRPAPAAQTPTDDPFPATPPPPDPAASRPAASGSPTVTAGPSAAVPEPSAAVPEPSAAVPEPSAEGGADASTAVTSEANASGPAVTAEANAPGPAVTAALPVPNPVGAAAKPAAADLIPTPTASASTAPESPGTAPPAPTIPASASTVPESPGAAPPDTASTVLDSPDTAAPAPVPTVPTTTVPTTTGSASGAGGPDVAPPAPLTPTAAQTAVVPAVPAPALTTGTRRRWPLWTVLGLALGLVAGAVPGVLLRQFAPDAAGQQTAGREAPGTAAERQLAARMVAQLDRQGSALLRGDKAGFLAVAEPTARPALTRRYAALRALRVTTWRPGTERVPVAVDGQPGQWRLTVTVGYCFVLPGCAPSTAELGTRWRLVGEEPRLVAVEPSRTDPTGVRPWEVDDLVVAVGRRALVATTPAQRAKLPGLLARAEAAARAADRYAVGPVPDRYLVYYAGKAEWQRWYGGGRPKWTAGYAVGVGGGRHDVVLNAQSLAPAGVDDLLRHELTHAASLPDQGYADRADWWLVEGLAEYAGADGQPVDRYEGLAEVRKLLRGGWSGRLDAVAPADDATDDRVGGAYGVGYLAVRHLVDRYGEQRVLDFFRAVVHQRRTPDEAADEVFGDPWPALHDDCVAYVRSAAG